MGINFRAEFTDVHSNVVFDVLVERGLRRAQFLAHFAGELRMIHRVQFGRAVDDVGVHMLSQLVVVREPGVADCAEQLGKNVKRARRGIFDRDVKLLFVARCRRRLGCRRFFLRMFSTLFALDIYEEINK